LLPIAVGLAQLIFYKLDRSPAVVESAP